MHSWKTPTPEQVNRVLQLTTRPAEFRYFLDRLENPLWIRSFFDHGLFQTPQGPLIDDAAGTVQFPAWPLSQFLASVALHVDDSQLLLAVVHQAAPTKNIRVQRDLLAVALALPGTTAGRPPISCVCSSTSKSTRSRRRSRSWSNTSRLR